MLSFRLSINVIIIVVSFKILDLCPIALLQQLWNTLYIKLIFGDGESSNFLQLQKYIWLASDSDSFQW